MRRSPGLVALTRRRFATPRSAVLVVVALAALAAFIVAGAPRALVGVIRAEVAYQIGEVPAALRDLSGTMLLPPDFAPAEDDALVEGWDAGAADVLGDLAQRLADNRADFEDVLVPVTDDAQFALRTATLIATPESLPADAPNGNVQLLADPLLRSALVLADGAWPAPWSGDGDIEIVLAAEAAERIQWPIGEVRALSGQFVLEPGTDAAVVLVGVVEAADPEADRWQHLPTGALTATIFDDGNRRPEATAVAYVDAAAWPEVVHIIRHGQTETTAWYPVDGDGAQQADPAELHAALRQATAQSVPLNEAGSARMRFSSDIVDVLGASLARATSASAILTVAAVGPLAVSVALVVLASVLIIRRRRADLTLMSARGAPIGRLRGLLAGEGLALGAPAAAVGVIAGVALAGFDAGPLPTVLGVLIGAIPAAALAMSLRPGTLTTERADLDTARSGRVARIVEGLVVLLAVTAVTLLVVRGIAPAEDAVDPLVIAAPLLATVALALAVVRLHPLPIAAALRVASRGRGVVGLVGAARNLREAAAGSTAVLAMLVAVAIAVFSSVVLATVDSGAQTAAERQVGADMKVSGPFLNTDQLEAIRGVDGVAAASGVLVGDRVSVEAAGASVTTVVVAVETEQLAVVQDGLDGALPTAHPAPGRDPVDAVASTALVDEVGDDGLTAAGTPIEVAGDVPRVLGTALPADFVVVDAADYRAITGLGFFPRTILVGLDADADVDAVSAGIARVIGGAHSVELLAERTAAIQASPAITALRVALLAALGLAVALSVVAVLLVAGVARDGRSRTISLLRTMGLTRRQSRGIVVWEFAPLGVTALVGGVVLGAILPLLVLVAVDLRPFTGSAAQPALAVDPVLTGALLVAVVVALVLAVVVGVVSARTASIATVLRTEED
ncbi:FtsX-like permease family protein [Microbacterium thalassium]|uniref:Putative ABC transport system permease protein n=1 Tax=Microbacterium thalassium TaxID=362649 RepID=A0A7X0KVK3_9MICO|nr:FtsX-like permease family protein [Microbacterium thalassium]MBB6392327.1 putative ABC transport system permease protein [Microbacterium thalassium]GLK23537.1 membrane protein [Microbacterium thalassium]